MALGDYILCCKCEVKLIYDGDRGQREWWEERFGKPPEIECPDCKLPRQPLTDEEIDGLLLDHEMMNQWPRQKQIHAFTRAIEAAHGIKETNRG